MASEPPCLQDVRPLRRWLQGRPNISEESMSPSAGREYGPRPAQEIARHCHHHHGHDADEHVADGQGRSASRMRLTAADNLQGLQALLARWVKTSDREAPGCHGIHKDGIPL